MLQRTQNRREMQQHQEGVEQDQLKQRILKTHEENTKLSQPIPAPKPTIATPPTQRYHGGSKYSQQYASMSKSFDANSQVCPVCGVQFPRTVNQMEIERHVNNHFNH